MNIDTTLVKGYDLSGGAANWTSADLSDYTNYYLDFIWSNVTGTLDGELLIRETSNDLTYESIETFTVDTADETRLKNNIPLSSDKINIKFTPNGITGGRLTIKFKAIESNLQNHKSDDTIHFTESSIDHTNIQNRGTNTHGEIDTHLALTNEHIDWTNATEDFKTTGAGKFTGDVGIGTTTPQRKLHVHGNVIRSSGASLGGIEFNVGTSSTSDVDWDVYTQGTSLIFRERKGADTIRMTIEAGGAVKLLGDLIFTGSGSGLVRGEISLVGNTNEITIVTQNVYVQITDFNTNGESNNTTPDHTSDHILIDVAGVYFITCSITLESIGGPGSTAEIEVQKNNGNSRLGALHVDRTLSGGGAEAGAIPMTGYATLAVNDTVEVWIRNETNTQNYIVEDITLSLTLMGG